MFLSRCILARNFKNSFHKIISRPAPGLGLGEYKYKLVADLSKQKELDSDPTAIQQIEFKYMLGTNSTIYWVLDKSKESILEFYKGTVKVY